MLTTSHRRGLEESWKLLRTQRQAGADTEPAPNRLIKPTRGVSRQMNEPRADYRRGSEQSGCQNSGELELTGCAPPRWARVSAHLPPQCKPRTPPSQGTPVRMRDPAGPHCPLGTPVRRCILTPYPAALTCAAELLGLLWYQVLDAAAVGEACVLVVGLEGLAGAVGLLRGLALFTVGRRAGVAALGVAAPG